MFGFGPIGQLAVSSPRLKGYMDEIVGWWKLDEGTGTTANDAVAGGVNGALTNFVGGDWSVGTGHGGKPGLQFNGSTKYISVPKTDTRYVSDGTKALTISYWVRYSSLPATWNAAAGRSDNYWCGANSDLFYTTFFETSPASGWQNYNGPSGKVTGLWYHVVHVFDWPNDRFYQYVNAVREVNASDNGVPSSGDSTFSGNFTIGQAQSQYTNGIISDVRFWGRALTGNEIERLFDDTKNTAVEHTETASASDTASAEIFRSASVVEKNRTTRISDNFNRADAGTLGPNWIFGTGTIGIASNRASLSDTVDALSTAQWNGASPLLANQWSQLTIGPSSGTATDRVYYNILRWLGDGQSYVAGYNAVTGEWDIAYIDDIGGYNPIAFDTGPALSAGDVLRFEAIGNVLSLYRNDVLVGTVSDSNITVTGRSGVALNLAGITGTASITIDDFLSGNFEPADECDATIGGISASQTETASATDSPSAVVVFAAAASETANALDSLGQVARETFDGFANNSLVDAHADWADVAGGSMRVVNPSGSAGKAVAGNFSTNSLCRYLLGNWSPNQWAEVAIIDPAAANNYVGAGVRCDGNGNGYFICAGYFTNWRVYLIRFVAGASTDITNVTALPTFVNGMRFRLQVTGQGSATRLTVYQDGTAILSNIDPAVYFNSGSPGIAGIDYVASATGIDVWNASDINASTTTFAATQSEAASATDAPSAVVITATSQTEAASATDTSDGTLSGIAASQTDSASAADAPSAIATMPATQAEPSSATDTPSAIGTFPAAISEAANAVDAPSAIATHTPSQSEPASATDTPSAGVVFPVSVTEAASANHTQDGAVGNFVGQSDTANAVDTPSATATFAPTQNEAASATDAPSAVVVFAAVAVEPANALDVPSANATMLASISEGTTASESSTTDSIILASITENANAVDVPSAVYNGVAGITEPTNALETQGANSLLPVSLSEAASADHVQGTIAVFVATSLEAGNALDFQDFFGSLVISQLEPANALDTCSVADIPRRGIFRAKHDYPQTYIANPASKKFRATKV